MFFVVVFLMRGERIQIILKRAIIDPPAKHHYNAFIGINTVISKYEKTLVPKETNFTIYRHLPFESSVSVLSTVGLYKQSELFTSGSKSSLYRYPL